MIATIRDALLLLQSGRVGMATRLLERLPELIEAERRFHAREIRSQCNVAYIEGRMAGERAMHRKLAPKPPPTPTGPRRHEWLQGVLAIPRKRALACDILRMDDALLDRIAAGKVDLSPSYWPKLRKALL
jgi:hypothetical protein